MNVSVFSAQDFEHRFLRAAAGTRHRLHLLEMLLSVDTAHLAQGAMGVSVFDSDDASEPVLEQLLAWGGRYVAVRAAGYDNVDLAAARHMGIQVAHVTEHPPYAIADADAASFEAWAAGRPAPHKMTANPPPPLAATSPRHAPASAS